MASVRSHSARITIQPTIGVPHLAQFAQHDPNLRLLLIEQRLAFARLPQRRDACALGVKVASGRQREDAKHVPPQSRVLTRSDVSLPDHDALTALVHPIGRSLVHQLLRLR